jgi:hypothetical protein
MLVNLHHRSNHLNSVQSHMIQENQVHEISIMWQYTNFIGCLNRHIMVCTAFWHNHAF